MRIQSDQDQTPGQGDFRIGFVVLDIPPEDIVTTRVANADELTPLRAPFSMFVKTGQSRWDVTVRWTALATDTGNGGLDYRQWEDLQYIVAMVKAAPFVEVENEHLRQVFFAIDPSMEHQRMAFGLRQLRVETSTDMVNALVCTLTMTYFNYYPYTPDFGYTGDKNKPVSAYLSPSFIQYIDTWVQQNLGEPSRDNTGTDFPSGQDWKQQIPGSLDMRWRRYLPISLENTSDQIDSSKFNAIVPRSPRGTIQIEGPYDQIFQREAGRYQLDPSLVKAIADKESGFTADAVNPNLPDRISAAQRRQIVTDLRNRIKSDPDGGLAAVEENRQKYGKYPDLGIMQINWINRSLQSGLRPVDLFDPNVGISLGSKFIAGLTARGITDDTIDAYNKGVGGVLKHGRPIVPRDTSYRDDVLARKAKYYVADPTQQNPDPSPTNSAVSEKGQLDMNAQLAAQVNKYNDQLSKNGWTIDYSTEKDAFFYQENQLLLTDESHGDQPNLLSLYPEGFVVLFINNLAQIPLAGYQYPTYQHVGPAATTVSIALKSNGLYDEGVAPDEQEPDHPGIQAVSEMAHALEDQFHALKARWRSVASVHRTQAVRVYNQVLNLLGVHSILLKDVTTATVDGSPNLVEVQLTASHYENFFESVSSYLVKGVKNAYLPQFLDYLKTDIDKGLTAGDKKTIFKLLQYRDALVSRDVNVIGQVLIDNKLGTLRAEPMPVSLTNAENQLLLGVLDSIQPGTTPLPSADTGIQSGTGITIAENYPDYAARMRTSISLTDLLLLSAIATTQKGAVSGDDLTDAQTSGIASILARQQASGAPYNTAMDNIYTEFLTKASQKDPLFVQQMNLVTTDPKFRARINANTGHAGGPGADHPDHGAYRDMGLRNLTVASQDLNPASYFYDSSFDIHSAIKTGVRQAVAQAAKNQADVNKQSSDAVVVTDSTQLVESELFLKTVVLPQTSMAAAYPTYKLFLLEEDNGGIFYAFDDFYSYSSVLDIEIIKYRDKPHLAEIRMTNLAHLLSHKMFDNTVMGKREASLNHETRVPVSKDMVISGPTGGVIENTGEDRNGVNFIQVPGRNLTEGMGPGYTEVPLAYFPLQPGTKIEIRMGAANNPDNLTRVFAGTVAEIEGDEILTIRAQGFQSELMEVSADKAGFDSWTLLNLGKGARFGGGHIWGDSGDTGTVMRKTLEASNAKHFGHWQLLRPENPIMRGWDWSRTIGIALESLGSTTLGPMLQLEGDRTGQNILINHVINSDGTITQDTRGKRTYFSQTPWWSFSAWYHLDEEKSRDKTIWDIIRDVSRRYPEYLLSVKDYGFPYGCDASLVFGHPRDSFYARPYNFDEGRNEKQLNSNASDTFRAWWSGPGRQLTIDALETARKESPYLLRALSATGIPAPPLGNLPAPPEYGPGNRDQTPDPQPVDIVAQIDTQGIPAFEDLFSQVADSTSAKIASFIASNTPEFFVEQGKYDQARRDLLALQRAWQSYRDTVNPPQFALLKPVRKYHYVDFQSIIANNITLNDKIFNAVRIQGKVVKANKLIPAQYTRVLDADDLIIQPEDNVENQGLLNAYAESFLREEVGKMYRGELILRGLPEIEPWDVIFMTDPSTGMNGPIEVEKVIHSFSQEQGYISIVTPRCYLSINEAAGQDIVHRLLNGASSAYKLVGAGFNEFAQADETAQRAAFLVPAAGTLTAAGTVAAVSGVSTSALAAPIVSLIPAAAASPPAWLAWAVLGSLAAGGAAYIVATNSDINPILISPLMRFGKPWYGGLEGYQVADFWRFVHEKWTQFWVDEVEPSLFSYRQIKGYLDDSLL